ncbi:hypothetical protein SAMN05428947_114155 [Mucilaginibacter sp. OK283]|nr:hypothetical protein SAMN05428947_114155 [Mucilaginibacter sp. OK283]
MRLMFLIRQVDETNEVDNYYKLSLLINFLIFLEM